MMGRHHEGDPRAEEQKKKAGSRRVSNPPLRRHVLEVKHPRGMALGVHGCLASQGGPAAWLED